MPIPIVTLRVPSSSDSVTCTNCGEEIPVVNKPSKAAENRLYCPGKGCGAVLKLYTEDGRLELNHWWAGLDTPVSREVGKMFRVAQFPSRPVADQWHEFEKRHQPSKIIASAGYFRQKLEKRAAGTRFWKDIISMVEKREGKAPTVAKDISDEQVIFFEVRDE